MSNKLIKINEKLYYRNIRCKCGCNNMIPYSYHHEHGAYNGIPDYIKYHNLKFVCIKEGEHRSSGTEYKSGNEHPCYKHGFSSDVSNSAKKGHGFKPINRRFEGSRMHHVDNERVIYIPKKLHESVRHNLKTGAGMNRINSLAWKFLDATTIEIQRCLLEF